MLFTRLPDEPQAYFLLLAAALSPLETIQSLAKRQSSSVPNIDPSEFPAACQSGCTSAVDAVSVSIGIISTQPLVISCIEGLYEHGMRLHVFQSQWHPILHYLHRKLRPCRCSISAIRRPKCHRQ